MTDAVGTTLCDYTSGGLLASEDGPWSSDTVSLYYVNRSRTNLTLLQPTAGPQPASTERIVGHELGHSATGTADDGPNRMNNVNQNENPIVTHLPHPEPPRTQY